MLPKPNKMIYKPNTNNSQLAALCASPETLEISKHFKDEKDQFEVGNAEKKFNSGDYPIMVKQLALLVAHTFLTPILHRAEIIISYLKDHFIYSKWLDENAVLVEILVLSKCNTSAIEALFNNCRTNKAFTASYEAYIINQVRQ